MHEFSLMADLLNKLRSIAQREHAGRIVKVSVRLGALSHISPEHFREHFSESVKGSPADGAQLEVNVSSDMTDPDAQDILLESVEVAD